MTWLGQGIIFDTSPDIEPESRHKYQIDIKQKKVSTKPTFHLTKEAKRPNKRLSRKTFCLNINFFIKILHVETDNCSPPGVPKWYYCSSQLEYQLPTAQDHSLI